MKKLIISLVLGTAFLFIGLHQSVSDVQAASLSYEQVAERLAHPEITGATIITHGFQLTDSAKRGDSLMPLAKEVHNKAGGWLIDYDIGDDEALGHFDLCDECEYPDQIDQGEQGEVVLLFDWAPESNRLSNGWGEAAGDALFSLIIGLGLIDPLDEDHIPLHFIAHSFGAAVTSEAIERFARVGVPVDHVTYLDPHDFDQDSMPVDESQRLWELGEPSGYGASIWNNVAFADVYYQTLLNNPFDPEGRPIPGAYNVWLNNLIPLSEILILPHSYVWKCFYRGTVLGNNPNDCTAGEFDYAGNGYAFSRLRNTTDRPDPNFFSFSQDHKHSCKHSDDCVVDEDGQPVAGALEHLGKTAQQFTHARWEPNWNPLDIVNGDFENTANRANIFTDIEPGWSHHGGGGEGDVECLNIVDSCEDEDNFYVELNKGDMSRTHNWLYVPHYATHLEFDLWRVDGPLFSVDEFHILLGNRLLNDPSEDQYQLKEDDNFEDDEFKAQEIPIPENLRGKVNKLIFEIAPGSGSVDSEARVDNVRFRGDECTPPPFRDWVIAHSCKLSGPVEAPGNVIVQKKVSLTIPDGTSLDIDFLTHYLRIKDGAKVVVQNSGKIH